MKPYLAVVLSSLALIAGLNAYVDPGHTGLRRLGPLTRAWTADELLILPDDFDARVLRREHLRLLPAPKILVLGSSRSMLFPGADESASLYNASMPAASLEDFAALWESERQSGKTPDELILSIDPWMFNRGYRTDRWKALAPLYYGFLAGRSSLPGGLARLLGQISAIKTNAEFLYSHACDLLSLDVLKKSVRVLRTDRRSALSLPRETPPEIVPRRERPAGRTAWRADGMVIHPDVDEAPRTDEDLARLSEEALIPGKFPMYADYAFDPDAEVLLRNLVLDAQKNGVRVSMIYPPSHPELVRRMSQDARLKSMIPDSTQALARVASATGTRLCLRMALSETGCLASDFTDSMHVNPACAERIFRGCESGK